MQKLVFRNANGIELDLTSDPFGITEWEGFSADELNIQSQQVPFQDGGVFLDALLDQRELSVTVAMNDENNLEKRYRLRREMISALNPKLGEGVLIYTNDFLSKQIHCIPQLPVFQNKNSNDSGTPKVSCSFTACNPYWEDLEDTVVELTDSENTIENNGDINIGIEMSIFCDKGFVSLKNVTQNKSIQLNDTTNGMYQVGTKTGNKHCNRVLKNFILKGCDIDNMIIDDEIYIENTSAVYKINNKNELERMYTDTTHALRTFLKKDGYIYFYEEYVGVRRTKDFNNIETVLAITSTYDFNSLCLTENGRLILVQGTNKYSDDGINWSDYTNNNSIIGIIYEPTSNKYYGYSNSYSQEGVYSSSDLQSWTKIYSAEQGSTIRGLYYNSVEQKFIFSIDNGLYTTVNFSSVSSVYTSAENINLFNGGDAYFFKESTSLKYTRNLADINEASNIELGYSICYATKQNGVFYIGLQNGNIIKSYDCDIWATLLYLDTNIVKSGLVLAKTNDEYYAGYTSANYVEGQDSGHYAVVVTPNVKDIIYSNNVFSGVLSVVRYNNKYYLKQGLNLFESTDGKDYTLKTTLSYDGYLFASESKLLLYYNGNIYSSTNGTSWETEETSTGYTYSKIIKCKTKYFGVRTSSGHTYIAESEDAIHFTNKQEVTVAVSQINAYKDGAVCVCTSSFGSDSIIYIITGEYNKTVVVEKTVVSGIASQEDTIYFTISKQGSDSTDLGMLFDCGDIGIFPENQLGYPYLLDSNGSIFANSYNGINEIKGEVLSNVINLLDSGSDMTLGLNVGENKIIKNFEGVCEIKYRQKYLGV